MEVVRRKVIYETAEKASKEIKYSQSECVGLLKMFFQIEDKSERGRIDRDTFRNFLHNTFGMTDSLMLERVYFVFDIEKTGFISAEQWLRGMSVFYEDHLMKKWNQVEEDPEEGVRDLVEIIFKKLDNDHDGRISMQDFSCSVKEDPLLLEALGECFPEDKTAAAFLSTFQEEVSPETISYISSVQNRHIRDSPSLKEK